MTRAIGAAVLGLLLLALPALAKPVDPYLTLDTPAPYHYGGSVEVTAHGDLPNQNGDRQVEVQLLCKQGDDTVHVERITIAEVEQPYALHLGGLGFSRWDVLGGGAADCRIHFYRESHRPATIWTEFLIHVEA